jgi:tRNA (cmo5U34)-methyltransferase
MEHKFQSQWSDPSFTRHYRDISGLQLPMRDRVLALMQAFYRYHPFSQGKNRIMDLGSGDGVVGQVLLGPAEGDRLVLVDGSPDMLMAARERFGPDSRVEYLHASFEEMIEKPPDYAPFSLVASSLAVHHIPLEMKYRLFSVIYRLVSPGGYFLVYDTVLPPTSRLEEFYMELWKQWIREQKALYKTDLDMESMLSYHHLAPEHHKNLDTMDDYMSAMRSAGFCEVDCIFKYGVFALICGMKKK